MQVIDWQVIVKKHGPIVWQTAYRLLGNQTDATDCFQETFVSALEFAQRQRVRNFPGLLVRLATARAIDRLRQRLRQPHSNMETANWPASISTDPEPAEQAERQELADRLRDALMELSPQEAQVFCLRYLNDMSYRQIAKQLGIKTNAAGVLLHRARIKLRVSFEPSSDKYKKSEA